LAEVEITSVISEARVEPIDTWWCKMSIIINESTLLYNGTCPKERERFVKEFPDGLELTVENIALARSRGFDIWLPGAYLHSMDLSGANLRGADLTGADLSNADLSGTNLGDWERGPDGIARRKRCQ
jgi:hypothetical protein